MNSWLFVLFAYILTLVIALMVAGVIAFTGRVLRAVMKKPPETQ